MSAGNTTNEFQPPVPVVLQEETPYGATAEPPVNVRTIGPVRTQETPHKAGATFTKAAITTAPQRLLTADHRRAKVVLVSIGQNMLVAFSNAAAQDPSRMALWPANVPLTLTNDSEVWVASATATTSVSVVTELWATGEDGVS